MTNLVRDPAAILAWCEGNRRSLSGHGLWFLGGEPNTQNPAGFAAARLRVLIVRLSEYTEVAAGITHSYLHQMAAGVEGVFVDLAYLPPAPDEKRMRQAGIPLLVGTGSKRPPADFEVIAISNSVVQELVNLPALLAHSGIPLSREARVAAGAPFLLLGGSNSSVGAILHGPVGKAEGGEGLVDGVIVGDGEGAFPRLLELVRDMPGAARVEVLARLRREVPGFYDPAAYRHEYAAGRLARIVPAPGAPFPVRANRADLARPETGFVQGPIFYHDPTAGASHVLVTAGCPFFCSFCKESWEQKPYRERPVEAVAADALRLKANLGLSEIAPMTFNLNTYSGLLPMLAGFDGWFGRVALKSQRFDAIARDPALLERQLEAGKRTYTCAMEGISDRLRSLLQKNLPEAVLRKGFQELFRRNIRQMKVFVIITGWEEEADFAEFGGLLEGLKKQMESLRGKPQLTFSFAVLFRPPRTPLQAMPRSGGEERLASLLARGLAVTRKAGFEARVSAGPSDALVSEWLAYGDRRDTAALVDASVERGFRYRGECGSDLWEFLRGRGGGNHGPDAKAPVDGALAPGETQVPPRLPGRQPGTGDLDRVGPQAVHEAVVARRSQGGGGVTIDTLPDGPFPWDDIDVGVESSFLAKNREALASGASWESCLAPPHGKGVCLGCGACRSVAERNATVKWKARPWPAPETGKEPKVCRFRVEAVVPRRWADCGNGFLAAALTRMLLQGVPGWVPGFWRFERMMPRWGAWGLVWGEFVVRGAGEPWELPGTWPLLEAWAGPLVIRSVVPIQKPGEEPGCHLRIDLGEPGSDPGKRVDAFLQKYRLAHQKRWEGDTLGWTLQPGHAKKCGLISIAWLRGAAFLDVRATRWPEPHVLPGLAGGHPVSEVVAFLPEGGGPRSCNGRGRR
ncbi:MAG: hypothetical protein GX442_02170 [Candidatus Riflebacteria bacterium]|nr:hypothetical protein [Candidatus Riflebacteria bacterium]